MTDAVLFWTIAVIVTGFVLLALVPPLLGRTSRVTGRSETTRALYRDQLTQIDADLAAERISPAEAEAARAAIGRRALRTADGESAAPSTPRPARRRVRNYAWAAAVVVVAPAAAVALYLTVGTPQLPDQPLSGRKDVADAAQLRTSAETLVGEMSAAVARDPNDLRSWVMLARALTTLDRLDEAVDAYAHAIALAPDAADLNAAYGEVLVGQANGQVTAQAAEAFRAALLQVPDDPRSRYYLALYHFQQGDLHDALLAWRSLEADSPPTAGWMDAVRARIAETETALGDDATMLAEAEAPSAPEQALGATEAMPADSDERDSADDGYASGGATTSSRSMTTGADASAMGELAAADAPAPSPGVDPGPTAPQLSDQQVTDMMNLTPEERSSRIAAMVNGLAARLQENPSDVDGWMILARSLVALGQLDSAREALANASHYGPDRIDAQIAYARVMLEGQPLDAPVPEEAIEAFKRVIAQDPTHPDALWFLGLAAAQKRDFATARIHWTRLLETLDPESEAYVDVQSYIAALSGNAPDDEAAVEAAPPPVDSANVVGPTEQSTDTE